MKKIRADEFPQVPPGSHFNGGRWGILASSFPPFTCAMRSYIRHRTRYVILRTNGKNWRDGDHIHAGYACGGSTNHARLTDDPAFVCAPKICDACERKVAKWTQKGFSCGLEVVPLAVTG